MAATPLQPIIRFDGHAFNFITTERFITALFMSLVVHAFFLLGTYFKVPDPAQFKSNKSSLDVVLVNSKSAERPRDPKVLAQANVDGGGNTDEDRRAKSPLPTMEDKITELEETVAQMAKQAQLPLEPKPKVMTSAPTEKSMTISEAEPDTTSQETMQALSTPLHSSLINQVLQRTRQISHLEAQISKDFQAYQQRPKRKFVGASAAEYKFAGYVEDWRQRIEEVGNTHYPEAARQQKIYGSLLITVAIRLDGTLENIEIVRSSGSKILDAAATRIVERAAPFSAFPLELRNDADVLHITRTWTFTKSDQLISE
jgi:periplasmic protein TonB